MGDPEYATRLRATTESYLQAEEFEPGEMVTWQAGLRGSAFPEYGAPASFVRYASKPEIQNRKKARADIDCLIGYLDEDWDFVVIPASSRRLTRWQQMGSSPL